MYLSQIQLREITIKFRVNSNLMSGGYKKIKQNLICCQYECRRQLLGRAYNIMNSCWTSMHDIILYAEMFQFLGMISLLINLTTFCVNYMVIYNMYMSLAIINDIYESLLHLITDHSESGKYPFSVTQLGGGTHLCILCQFQFLQILPYLWMKSLTNKCHIL